MSQHPFDFIVQPSPRTESFQAPAVFGSHVAAEPAENVSAYEFLRSAAAIEPSEVELSEVEALEVLISWGDAVVHVAHRTTPTELWVGESNERGKPCDFLLPSAKLGAPSWPLITLRAGVRRVLLPANAQGYLQREDGTREQLSLLRAAAEPSLHLDGAHSMALPAGARLRLEIADLSIVVSSVRAGKPTPRGVSAGFDKTAVSYFGLSFLGHAALLSALGFFVPPLGLNDDEGLDRDRLYVMQQYLDSAAERERQQETAAANEAATAEEGGTGEGARAEEGAMGKPTSTATNKRYAVRGPQDNPDPHVSKASALAEAQSFGMVALLSGDPNAPTSPFGRSEALGKDALSAQGAMWGDELGDAIGGGGLGVTGIGEGGGRHGIAIGMGDVGTLGHGRGLGDGQGFGDNSGIALSHGRLRPTHTTRAPKMRGGTLALSGRLPPEVIQRVVRQNFGRFRFCYEQGLTRNPNLEGRVSVRFVIGRDGGVSNVANGGADLPDSGVASCVVSAFYGLSFPAPEQGIVSVVYPISFSPG